MPAVLPRAESGDWAQLYRRMIDSFVWGNLDVRPPVRASRLLIIHPDYARLEAEARAIFNDEVAGGEDGDGNAIPLPRVWRWEHHFHVFFVIELPEGISGRALLLRAGDRELNAACWANSSCLHGVAVFAHDSHAVAQRRHQSVVGEVALLLFASEAHEEGAFHVGIRPVHAASADFGEF
jgi:hypothetical protein